MSQNEHRSTLQLLMSRWFTVGVEKGSVKRHKFRWSCVVHFRLAWNDCSDVITYLLHSMHYQLLRTVARGFAKTLAQTSVQNSSWEVVVTVDSGSSFSSTSVFLFEVASRCTFLNVGKRYGFLPQVFWRCVLTFGLALMGWLTDVTKHSIYQEDLHSHVIIGGGTTLFIVAPHITFAQRFLINFTDIGMSLCHTFVCRKCSQLVAYDCQKWR